ncbi:cytochrome c oxidase, subunit VIa [Thamnocephalis sphaerospora]|uniref:Cytochrome c oxidase subunit 13, mitochondrial n=1 Tax=Thamnocephalis sphaerospora TaxID=78915 RepID=A0A4P9XV80_9FUNG|nr:cytochrome c oxidase, subunit VIa [Thamnocephalis sphaerospora]|eukprot:RKP10156.1 cytochrome c oxidase, subunit VIa [Thamnocephalis sphaerospora]
MFATLRILGRNVAGRRAYSAAAQSSFAAEREAVREHAAQASEIWRKVSYCTIPALLLAGYNAYRLAVEHEEHQAHHPTEHIAYSYMNIHNKPFPFGDGEKSLFWNPKVNGHE